MYSYSANNNSSMNPYSVNNNPSMYPNNVNNKFYVSVGFLSPSVSGAANEATVI